MDIGSKSKYPSCALSNFAPHPFVIDEVECMSMEGFLQSLKFKNPLIQVEVCKLVGFAAKKRGAKKNWKRKGVLYWQGEEFNRYSDEYQELLNKAYGALAKNAGFQKAILATNKAVLRHSMGKRRMKDTILTESEFCSRLTDIREQLKKYKEDKNNEK